MFETTAPPVPVPPTPAPALGRAAVVAQLRKIIANDERRHAERRAELEALLKMAGEVA